MSMTYNVHVFTCKSHLQYRRERALQSHILILSHPPDFEVVYQDSYFAARKRIWNVPTGEAQRPHNLETMRKKPKGKKKEPDKTIDKPSASTETPEYRNPRPQRSNVLPAVRCANSHVEASQDSFPWYSNFRNERIGHMCHFLS